MNTEPFAIGDKVTWDTEGTYYFVALARVERYGSGPFTVCELLDSSPDNIEDIGHPQTVRLKEIAHDGWFSGALLKRVMI